MSGITYDYGSGDEDIVSDQGEDAQVGYSRCSWPRLAPTSPLPCQCLQGRGLAFPKPIYLPGSSTPWRYMLHDITPSPHFHTPCLLGCSHSGRPGSLFDHAGSLSSASNGHSVAGMVQNQTIPTSCNMPSPHVRPHRADHDIAPYHVGVCRNAYNPEP